MKQTASQAEHDLDCPEKAVLSFLKSVLYLVREHIAGGLSGLEQARLHVLLLPTHFCLVPKLLPNLRLCRV